MGKTHHPAMRQFGEHLGRGMQRMGAQGIDSLGNMGRKMAQMQRGVDWRTMGSGLQQVAQRDLNELQRLGRDGYERGYKFGREMMRRRQQRRRRRRQRMRKYMAMLHGPPMPPLPPSWTSHHSYHPLAQSLVERDGAMQRQQNRDALMETYGKLKQLEGAVASRSKQLEELKHVYQK